MQIKNYSYKALLSLLFIISIQFSCKKYLDAKPDKAIVIPSTLQDLQALLDNTGRMNNGISPGLLEMTTDDYWLSYTNLTARNDFEQKIYLWDKNALSPLALSAWWVTPYTAIFHANVVLDELPHLKIEHNNDENMLKGSAFFFRGFGYYYFAQLFCKPYNYGSQNTDPGVVMRLTSSFSAISVRNTVQQTYDQIISDLKEAAHLLPITSNYKTRPSKAAAFAALARTYLSMEDYDNAGKYADSCLQLYSTLIDYNSVTATAPTPFVRYNEETIFFSFSNGNSMLNPTRANVDSILYKSYSTDDLRKTVFFQDNGNGNYGFKGSYIGGTSGAFFSGLATDEMYLTRAECYARKGNKDGALTDLNTLLIKRWARNAFIPYTANTAEDALIQIITERRKELIMRGVRWSDLRRLNKDPRFAKTLKRVLVNGNDITTYTLPPNDLRYVLLIPADVIALTGMEQNPR